jgi:hypothetical protein
MKNLTIVFFTLFEKKNNNVLGLNECRGVPGGSRGLKIGMDYFHLMGH